MLQLVFLLLFIYLSAATIYLLVLAVAGNYYRSKQFARHPQLKRIAVIIPAIREDSIIVDTAIKAAAHNYAAEYFQVFIIADKLRADTISRLRNIPVEVLEVNFEISTKAKSIKAALAFLKGKHYEIAMMLDADNIMQDGCLEKVNDAFNNHCKAVQCHRIAKNENTAIALLGAISEEININLFRKGPAALGLSIAPLGSGMAFDFTLLKEIFDVPGITENPAEDREIEVQLMKRQLRMEFLSDVYIYDEKVAETVGFENQRIRWLEAQLNHITRFFKPDLIGLPKTPVYYHTFLQNLILPRLLYILVCFTLLLLLSVQWIFDVSFIYPADHWWIAWITLYGVILMISVPARFYNLQTLKAVAYLPVLTGSMLKALLKIRRNRKEFIHTSKTFSSK